MPATIEQLLGAPQLIDMIQTVKSGIPRVLPDPFFTLTRNVVTDFASFFKVNGTRRLPKTSAYGSPSRASNKQDVGETFVKLLHTIENQQFGQIILTFLNGMQATGSVIVPQVMAEQELLRQTVQFKQKFENLRTAAVTSMVANGKIFMAADGTFLPNSTGAANTIDYGVPSAQVGALNAVLGSAFLSWDNVSADIIGAIIALKQKALQTTGFPLKYAFYGVNIPGYVTRNTAANALMRNNPKYNEAALAGGDFPDGFMGLTWIPVYNAFFEDDNGVIQQFFGNDQISFLPEITTEWYELLQGSYVIKPNAGIYSGVTGQSLATALMPYGMFSYAMDTNDPVGTKQVMGDTFLPVNKNGSVQWSLTVKY